MKRLFLWWLGLWALGVSFSATSAQGLAQPFSLTAATPYVTLDARSDYWIDENRSYTPAQVEAAGDTLPWALRKIGAHFNIDSKALWVRFDANTLNTSHWFVEVNSSGIDRVQLFYRDDQGRWVEQEAGDTRSVTTWPIPGRFPTFELAHSSRTVRYWLRIEHTRVNFGAGIAVRNHANLAAAREGEQFLLGGYFGLAGLIFLVTVANAIVFRDRNFGAYAVYVFTLAAGQLAYLGVGAQHVWTDALRWNETATFLLPGLSSAAGLWFVRTVTEPARFSRWLDLGVWAMLAAVLSAVAMDTYLASRASFTLVIVLTVLTLILIVLLIVKVWREGNDPFIRYVAMGFFPVLLMALFPLARGLNLIPNSLWTRYGLSIGAALEMPILFYAMTLRGNRRRDAKVRAAALSYTDALTGVAHRHSLQMRLDNALTRAHGQQHQCGLLLIHVTNHEAIANEYGREAADRALVLTASRLRHVITDMDMAARVDEHHFALLIEGPTLDLTVQACATRVVASGLRESPALPPGVTLKLNVAHAMLPAGDLGAEECLQRMYQVVSEMGADARKSIRQVKLFQPPT